MGMYQDSPTQSTLLRASIWMNDVTAVFPCNPDKTPATDRGFKDASIDPRQVTKWFQNEKFLIGVPTEGYIVVDLDRHYEGIDGLMEWWRLAEENNDTQSWKYTYMVSTPSGGRHMWFTDPTYPDAPHKNTASKLAPGIDTRSSGGYVIIPPSRTPAGQYTEHTTATDPPEGRRILPPPSWLLELLAPKERNLVPVPVPATGTDRAEKYARAALNREIDILSGTGEGGRNHALNKAAFSLGTLVGASLLDRGMVESQLEAVGYNLGLTEWEIDRTIESGIQAGMANPRGIPEGAPK